MSLRPPELWFFGLRVPKWIPLRWRSITLLFERDWHEDIPLWGPFRFFIDREWKRWLLLAASAPLITWFEYELLAGAPEGRFHALVAEGIPLVLGFLALFVGVVHLKEIEPELRKLGQLVEHSIGLENYIDEAAKLYQKKKVERVVTTIRHWASTGRAGKAIESALQSVEAREIWFIGKIFPDVHLPGVVWRLNRIFASDGCERVRLLHVSSPLPLFVVSREDTSSDGSLLVANPRPFATTENYGFPLGEKAPEMVAYFNFFFDAIIRPLRPNDRKKLNESLAGLGAEVPHVTAEDGLKRVVAIIGDYLAGDGKSTEDLIDRIAGDIYRKVRHATPEERLSIMDEDKFVEELRRFLAHLTALGFVVEEAGLVTIPNVDISLEKVCGVLRSRVQEGSLR